jgi:hypothetical protein
MFDAIADAALAEPSRSQRLDTVADALSFLEPLVLQLCRQATSDPAS